MLGVIPARGGSKAIPDKNIATVAGLPLIAWTIAAARSAGMLQRVIVTTDSPRIVEIAVRFGAEAPFLRPPDLAQDDTPGIEPILHALRWLEEHEASRPDYCLVLQPTSPLRTGNDIKAAVALAREKNADSVVSVCATKHHPYWMKRVAEDGRLEDFTAASRTHARRQDLPPVYSLNGAIYLVRPAVLLRQRTFYTSCTYAYVMPAARSLDIDSAWDMQLADLILKDQCTREHS